MAEIDPKLSFDRHSCKRQSCNSDYLMFFVGPRQQRRWHHYA